MIGGTEAQRHGGKEGTEGTEAGRHGELTTLCATDGTESELHSVPPCDTEGTDERARRARSLCPPMARRLLRAVARMAQTRASLNGTETGTEGTEIFVLSVPVHGGHGRRWHGCTEGT